MLDVGAGSGRDAAWFADRGWDVVAVEPAESMRHEARRRHPDAPIRWLGDRLPGLEAVHRLGLMFDLIWLSAVWMHVARILSSACRGCLHLAGPPAATG